MLRYLIIATALVFVVGGIAAALHRGGGDLRMAAVRTTASPSPPRAEAGSTFTPGPVTGDAPWVFDALVDCFHHERTFHGTLALTSAHVPRGAQRLRSGDVLHSGPCTAYVARDNARVCSGPCRGAGVDVRVPPHLRVYASAAGAVYVERWTQPNDARVDRLALMPGARIERAAGKVSL